LSSNPAQYFNGFYISKGETETIGKEAPERGRDVEAPLISLKKASAEVGLKGKQKKEGPQTAKKKETAPAKFLQLGDFKAGKVHRPPQAIEPEKKRSPNSFLSDSNEKRSAGEGPIKRGWRGRKKDEKA